MFNRPRPTLSSVWQSRSTWPTLATVASALTSGIAGAIDRVRLTIDQLRRPGERVQRRDQPITLGRNNRDRLRQLLNVIFAVGQVVTTYLTVVTGADEQFSTRTTADPPIIPAPYTFFVIWTVIYASTIAYAIYQALPAQRENLLFRRIGFWTAAAFAGTSLWLVAAVQGWVWLTAGIFFGILGALLVAFVQLIRVAAPRSRAERFLVVAPLSIYTAWATIGTIANVASALNTSGWINVAVAPQTWAVLLLAVAGGIASFVATVSRGNGWYVLTILWALTGIVVANASLFPIVAIAAGAAGVVISLAWLRAALGVRPGTA